MKVAVLASGRGTNLQSLLDRAAEGKLRAEVALVISDNPSSRALERAAGAGVEILALSGELLERQELEQRMLGALEEAGVQLVVLAGYMRLLSKFFLTSFPGEVINIHPSLLPSFPGLNAQKQALDYGVKVSGCTVHFVDQGMDTGPIILQQAVPIKEDDGVEELGARILKEEHSLLPEAVNLYAQGKLKRQGRRVIIQV